MICYFEFGRRECGGGFLVLEKLDDVRVRKTNCASSASITSTNNWIISQVLEMIAKYKNGIRIFVGSSCVLSIISPLTHHVRAILLDTRKDSNSTTGSLYDCFGLARRPKLVWVHARRGQNHAKLSLLPTAHTNIFDPRCVVSFGPATHCIDEWAGTKQCV